ncbi:MAG: hypothetical protein AAGN66_21020 [Acidobacteriota bacterium]
MYRILSIATASFTLLAALAQAQDLTPVGDVFQVNGLATGAQSLPSVDGTPDGGFVAVWLGPGVRAQRFDSAGNPVGAELQIALPPVDVTDPGVAVKPDGSFLVTWQEGLWPNPVSTQGRLVDPSGQFVGNPFPVLAGGGGFEPIADVTSDGDYIVTWRNSNNDQSSRVFATIFDQPGGTPPSFEVGRNQSSLATGADGTFAVVSRGYDPIMMFTDVRYGLYGNDGTVIAQGPLEDFAGGPVAAMRPGGDFLALWATQAGGLSGAYIDSTGVVRREFLHSLTLPRNSTVAAAEPGNVLVSWATGNMGDIGVQLLSATGDPLGGDFVINTTSIAFGLDVASLGSGEYVVVWASEASPGADNDQTSILGRRLRTPHVFSNGFETGGMSAWTVFP